jgi:predicted branched-subunit amino acid permease
MLPLVASSAPFGLVIGVAIGSSGNVAAGWIGTPLINGGSAQLMMLQLLQSGSGVWIAAVTGLLLHARMLVYSAELVPLWSGRPLRHRFFAASLVNDLTWMLALRQVAGSAHPSSVRRHYFGAGTVFGIGWIASVTAGLFLGTNAELSTVLAVCIPLCLSSMVGPHLRVSGGVRCVAAAAGVAVATSSWSPGLSMVAAMTAGAACGGSSLGRRRLP